jgi:hypothetical protein
MKKLTAVSDTGPILHLCEISLLSALDIFSRIIIPYEVNDELKKYNINFKRLDILNLGAKYKDRAFQLVNEFDIDLGEAEALSLFLQEKPDLFLTDDLNARAVANAYGIEAHGSVGIILRAYKEKIIKKQTAIKAVTALYEDSSLFITKDIIGYIISEIEKA